VEHLHAQQFDGAAGILDLDDGGDAHDRQDGAQQQKRVGLAAQQQDAVLGNICPVHATPHNC
jgi:hypothetical protein